MKISEKWRNDTGAILKRSWRKFEKIPSKTAKNHLKMILRWFKESSAKFWLKIPRCRSRTSSKKSRNPEIPLCRPSLGRILNNYWNQNTTNIYIYIYSSIYLYMPVILIKSSRIDVRNTNQVPTSASNLWKMAPVPSRRTGLRFNSSLQSSFLFYSLLPLASTEAVQVNWISRYIWPFMIPPVPLRRKIIPSLRTLLFDSLILWFFDSLILWFSNLDQHQRHRNWTGICFRSSVDPPPFRKQDRAAGKDGRNHQKRNWNTTDVPVQSLARHRTQSSCINTRTHARTRYDGGRTAGRRMRSGIPGIRPIENHSGPWQAKEREKKEKEKE